MFNRFTVLLIVVIGAFSCGNPHLVSDDKKEGENLISKEVNEKLIIEKEIVIKNSDGASELSFGQLPLNLDNKRIIIIQNISDVIQNLTFNFDKGQYFYFSGNKFPGLDGDCGETLRPNTSCKVEINFQSTLTGIFEDYLIISSLHGKIYVPLSGERKQAKDNSGDKSTKIIFQKYSLSTELDFGEMAIGSNSLREIEINNLTDQNVKVSELNLDSKVFKLKDSENCKNEVSKQGCRIQISFAPEVAGNVEAQLIVKDEDGAIVKLKLKGKGVLAERCFDKKEKMIKPDIKKIHNKEIQLPYLLSGPATDVKLNLLYGTDYNVKIKTVSLRTVKDAEVVVDYDLSAIPFNAFTDIKIDLDVWKVIADDYKDTEIICLSSKTIRKCSGRLFSLPAWQKLINPKFWNNAKLVNDKFEQNMAKTEKKCGETSCEVIRGEYSLKGLFELSESEMMQLKKDRFVSIVLADDSRFLSLPTLTFIFDKEVSCEKK